MGALLKVGELARKSGVSVRTLHHYDAIGLLSPTTHTGSGHRLYGEADVARLQRIVSLRALGFTLEQIAALLAKPDLDPVAVVEMHLAALREQVAAQQRLCERLEALASGLRASATPSVDEFLLVVEMTTMIEKYYTPEQLEYLRQRRETVGEARIQQVQQEWADLFAAVRKEMDAGTDPAHPRVKELAKKWQSLIAEFTGGDAGVAASARRMYEETMGQPDGPAARYGLDPAMWDYISRAMTA